MITVRQAVALGAVRRLAGIGDRAIVGEVAVPDAGDIDGAARGKHPPAAPATGEIVPSRAFYDYESKSLDEGSRSIIPADLPAGLAARVQRLSIEAFKAIDGAGMSRVDFLLSRTDGALFLNEVNTIP